MGGCLLVGLIIQRYALRGTEKVDKRMGRDDMGPSRLIKA